MQENGTSLPPTPSLSFKIRSYSRFASKSFFQFYFLFLKSSSSWPIKPCEGTTFWILFVTFHFCLQPHWFLPEILFLV